MCCGFIGVLVFVFFWGVGGGVCVCVGVCCCEYGCETTTVCGGGVVVRLCVI